MLRYDRTARRVWIANVALHDRADARVWLKVERWTA
jgi:hypothetical protein